VASSFSDVLHQLLNRQAKVGVQHRFWWPVRCLESGDVWDLLLFIGIVEDIFGVSGENVRK